MEFKKHEVLEQRLCKELENLENKLSNGAAMTPGDLDMIDKIYHALKSKATYEAMKEAEEYDEEGMSGRRGRSPRTGRYVSRDGVNPQQSYAEGYSEGYADASGHMPRYPMPPRMW